MLICRTCSLWTCCRCHKNHFCGAWQRRHCTACALIVRRAHRQRPQINTPLPAASVLDKRSGIYGYGSSATRRELLLINVIITRRLNCGSLTGVDVCRAHTTPLFSCYSSLPNKRSTRLYSPKCTTIASLSNRHNKLQPTQLPHSTQRPIMRSNWIVNNTANLHIPTIDGTKCSA